MSKTFYEIHFTGEGFRTLAVYRLFFKAVLREIHERRADYEREVAEWYRDNPGYQFPYCIHGTSLITDYDNICGGCEDSSTPVEEAIIYGRERFLRFLDRWEWVSKAPGDLSFDTRTELMEWAVSLFPKGA